MELKARADWRSKDRRPDLPEQTSSGDSRAGNSVRLLLVDDNPDDRALISRALRREFPKLTITEVSNQEKLNSALAAGEFDLLITDYQLYWSNGLEVFKEVKARMPDVSAVMFTGTGNEEIAVEAIKAGINDYVLKSPSHYSRLLASVQRALEVRRHQQDLSEAEARYKHLFDTVPVGLFRCTPQGQILDGNAALAAIVGCNNRAELLRLNFADLHPDSEDFATWRENLERDGSVAFIEVQFKDLTGLPRWVEIHAKALRDTRTGQIYYEGSVEDISERKQAETEREKLIDDLQEALAKVKSLAGLLPICSSCKKIRDEEGTWNVLETYIENHSHAHFTHSFCPDCAQRLYPEVFLDTPKF